MDPAPTQSSSDVSLAHTLFSSPLLEVEDEGRVNQASMKVATLMPVDILHTNDVSGAQRHHLHSLTLRLRLQRLER